MQIAQDLDTILHWGTPVAELDIRAALGSPTPVSGDLFALAEPRVEAPSEAGAEGRA